MLTAIRRRAKRVLDILFPPKTFLNCDAVKNSLELYKFAPQKDFEFNPQTALWLAAATMGAYNVVCGTRPTPPVGISRDNLSLLHAFTGSTKHMQVGYIANIEENDPEVNRIVIALAGTSDITQLIADLEYHQLPFHPDDKDEPKVHGGFHKFVTRSASRDQKSLLAQVKTQLKNRIQSGKNEIYICGHSLGGAGATILAALLLEHLKDEKDVDIILYTYGSPRTGDPAFIEHIQELARNFPSRFVSYRVVNTEDIVSHTPPPVAPISRLNFQHLVDWQTIGGKNKSCYFGTYMFGIHNKSITRNHAITTYYEGILIHPNNLKETK